MFKKILATLATVLLGAGLSIVAVAAPASAHTPNETVNCSSLRVYPTSYENPNNSKPNKLTVWIDDVIVEDTTFGTSFDKTYTFSSTTSHSWKYTIDAIGGSGPNTQYDVTKSGVTTPCTYPSKSFEVTCSTATFTWGAKLINGIHINLEAQTAAAGIKQIHANFDLNIVGGYQGLGIRFTDINGNQTTVPLTEQQVKSGTYSWNFSTYLGGATGWKVRWAQMDDLHFNDPIVEHKILNCDWKNPVTVSAFPSVTNPTCSTAGSLVIPTQEGVHFTGGTHGAGPGTYDLVAVADDGYVLTAPYSITLTVLPADTSLCKTEPKASVQPGVCTTTQDGKSQKSVVFLFDNGKSEVAVTFTIPSLGISELVAAGATKGNVDGGVVQHATGGSWDVYVNGEKLTTLTVAPFEACLTLIIPGDPSSENQKCVAGELTQGSITVKPEVGKIVYTITGGTLPVEGITVPDNDPKTVLPAGTYKVTAHGIGGFTVGPENTWTYDVVLGKPVDCEKVTIPVSTMSQMACKFNKPTGTYTLPATKWVEWYVNDVLATTPVDVNSDGPVKVEARITAAGITAGIVFTDGSTSKTVTHVFVLPAENCDPPTLVTLYPTATPKQGTCSTTPTFTLSNTTSPNGGVQWKVGNPQTNIAPGTHPAAFGSKVELEATLVNPVKDGFESYPQKWTFTFDPKPATCGDITTLALTGATGGFVLWTAGALLLLGGAGIYFTRRQLAARK